MTRCWSQRSDCPHRRKENDPGGVDAAVCACCRTGPRCWYPTRHGRLGHVKRIGASDGDWKPVPSAGDPGLSTGKSGRSAAVRGPAAERSARPGFRLNLSDEWVGCGTKLSGVPTCECYAIPFASSERRKSTRQAQRLWDTRHVSAGVNALGAPMDRSLSTGCCCAGDDRLSVSYSWPDEHSASSVRR